VLSTRRLDGGAAGVLQRSRAEARQLAAQYNASLFVFSAPALEHAEAQRSPPRGRAAAYASDPAMLLAWQLAAQLPPRAVVLVDIRGASLTNWIRTPPTSAHAGHAASVLNELWVLPSVL
jgi:hypothetical protein